MRYITIEDTLYSVTEDNYKKIMEKRFQLYNVREYYNGRDMDMRNFLDSVKMKELGYIDFDFRL